MHDDGVEQSYDEIGWNPVISLYPRSFKRGNAFLLNGLSLIETNRKNSWLNQSILRVKRIGNSITGSHFAFAVVHIAKCLSQ